MKRSALVIGTRGSLLALAQAKEVRRRLAALYPRKRFVIKIIKTMGDEYQSVALFKKNNIGVFTKAIEKALLNAEIDIAVHSLKDLPTDSPKGLCLAAVPKREDVRDALVSRQGFSLKTLPMHSVVGTGSPRRKRQLALLRPDLKLVDIRGNLDTRVRRTVREGKQDAILIALAGLLRVKKYLKYAAAVSEECILPAVGQAALGLQVRRADTEVFGIVRRLNHAPSETAVTAERTFLRALHGGCRVPVGILTRLKGNRFSMRANVFSVNNSAYVAGEVSGSSSKAAVLAKRLASQLIRQGAGKFMREARS